MHCVFYYFDESLTQAICTFFFLRCPETIPRGTSQALEALKAVQPPIVHAQQMLSVPGWLDRPCFHVKSTGPQKNPTERKGFVKTLTNPEILLSSFTNFDPAPRPFINKSSWPNVPVVHLIARKRAQRFGVSTSPLASCWIFTFWRDELNGCNLGCNQSDEEKERKIKT